MSSTTAAYKMTYGFLGNSCLLVSKFWGGGVVNVPGREEHIRFDAWYQMVQTAFKNGINLFDSAENYAMGRADELMDGAIKGGGGEGGLMKVFGVERTSR
ncbi:NADP-dependent oxidoreductase domain [Phytophthora cactorum]|nr:NADP-dependent oxidoreductase domain [Phytophthora cactorum]